MVRQSEVVIGGQIQQLPPITPNLNCLGTLERLKVPTQGTPADFFQLFRKKTLERAVHLFSTNKTAHLTDRLMKAHGDRPRNDRVANI
jgi:hypothetical protein